MSRAMFRCTASCCACRMLLPTRVPPANGSWSTCAQLSAASSTQRAVPAQVDGHRSTHERWRPRPREVTIYASSAPRTGYGSQPALITSRETTADLVELYTAAVRMAMLQHPSLDGLALGTRWIDESYDELEYDDSRTIAAGLVNFGVDIDAVVDAFGGPKTPPDDPCRPR
jgi:hypothetical protein